MAIDLSTLRRSALHRPPRIIIHGPHKIGKSTWAASAPNGVFLCAEEGVDEIDVPNWPITSEQDAQDAIGSLITEEHDFQTVVLDTADWLEQMIWSSTAAEHGKENIEGFDYGKGYLHAASHWKTIIEGFDILRNEKNMTIIILAHSQIRRFDDPVTASFDRYVLDLHKSASSLLCEWCDIIGFMNYRVSIEKKDVGFKKEIVRGRSGGDRVLFLEERPGFIAGNRYGLQESLSIPRVGGWQVFQDELTRAMTPLPPATEETKTKGRAKAPEQKGAPSGK